MKMQGHLGLVQQVYFSVVLTMLTVVFDPHDTDG